MLYRYTTGLAKVSAKTPQVKQEKVRKKEREQTILEFQSLHENDKFKILLEGPTSSLVEHHNYKCHKLRGTE